MTTAIASLVAKSAKSEHNKRDSETASRQAFLLDVYSGLGKVQKTLPCKYFYNECGSKLFEDICELPEYYLTRTEMQLLSKYSLEISKTIGRFATIIEPGAGAGLKVQILIASLQEPQNLFPLDISPTAMEGAYLEIKKCFPKLNVAALTGDFTRNTDLDRLSALINEHEPLGLSNRLVFFPGSTIGNFAPLEVEKLLCNFKRLAGKHGNLLIGIDLLKKRETLLAAYNDKQGTTEAFNKNLLHRINIELGGNFDVENGFHHRAVFNAPLSRVEMHLVSNRAQAVSIGKKSFQFREGETIHTENSHKYSILDFQSLANSADLRMENVWKDSEDRFALVMLR